MDIVGQKDDVITRLQDLISHLEETVKDYVSCTYLNFLYTKNLDLCLPWIYLFWKTHFL